ncbi:hypothetical protein XSR1_180012 [Xenorhabdus szentirmaii DSM 16338]|uniref:Uncharacterized protein n=1 Tax=Xenorhabdus szentirmaii DSM 16338 TaxID=1427518 RepID=W1IVY8_9GAMM|nr:hypothetical protein XSR1_180012 [Xenorhabdus szentirmaii DSM 16338]
MFIISVLSLSPIINDNTLCEYINKVGCFTYFQDRKFVNSSSSD